MRSCSVWLEENPGPLMEPVTFLSLTQVSFSNSMCPTYFRLEQSEVWKNPESPHIAKRTSLLILWEITNDSSEYVFIVNYISELCLQALESQYITMSTFLLFSSSSTFRSPQELMKPDI